MEQLVCLDSTATFLGIFDPSIAPSFLYYAYIPIIFISLFLGIFILSQKTNTPLRNKIFFLLTLIYSLHLVNEIVQWIAVPASVVAFSWALIVLFYLIITALVIHFTHLFLDYNRNSFRELLITFVLLFPVILFLPTELNIKSLDIVNCYSNQGVLFDYTYYVMYASLIYLAYLFIQTKKKQSRLIILGGFFTILVLLLADRISENYELFEINLVGPVGMLIMLSIIAYLMTESRMFGKKVLTTKMLVIALSLLIASAVFVISNVTGLILVVVTCILSIFGGYLLVKSVEKEVSQREEIEKLAKGLEKANNRLRELDKQKSEFVSIASHQLRSPLTAMRGYASMLVEGSFGPINDKQREVLTHIQDSGKLMASSIEDYLSISRIESGNMKYEYSDFNLKELAEQLVDELRGDATRKGLLLLYKSDVSGQGLVHADKGKVYQILHNLMNNSIKYTPKGTVSVFVKDTMATKTIEVSISDTGIGMNSDTITKLFEKFSRAENANSVNIRGTGLGLYVARALARAQGGDVTAASEGDGKGSTFTFTIPFVQ